MSALIGSVMDDTVIVYASRGGVELFPTAHSFNPIAARALAALLVCASEEVERMRARPDDNYTSSTPTRVEPHVPDRHRQDDVDKCSGGRR